MKKIIITILTISLLAPIAALASGGHYVGGHGSSHKSGKYENPRTGNHYEKHY